MKIEQLQQLLQIVAEGSMNEAAQKLYAARRTSSGQHGPDGNRRYYYFF